LVGRAELGERGFVCPECGRYRYLSNPFPPGTVGILTNRPCECPFSVLLPKLFEPGLEDESGQHTRDISRDSLVGFLGDDYWESPESTATDDEDYGE
jgi:hypothetical protein